MEEWRDIKGYEGKYQVSNLGRVKSLKNCKGNCREKILKLRPNKNGYIRIELYIYGKNKKFPVHRLVAAAFIPNPDNYKEVNHKDEDKTNNRVDNLEWCTRKYNANYGTMDKRISEKMKGREFTEEHKKKISEKMKGSKHPRARKILCVTTGEEFNCIKEAIKFYSLKECTDSSITMCCQGKLKSAGKHPVTGEKLVWKYID